MEIVWNLFKLAKKQEQALSHNKYTSLLEDEDEHT
jgi:hypothetical protein